MNLTRIDIENISIYSIGHFLIDFLCAGIIFSLINTTKIEEIFFLIIFYNILAFGLQLPVGYLCDIIKKPKGFSIIGLVLGSIAIILMTINPIASIIIAGIGNAFFHIGSGTISLNILPKKATVPGIIVSTGAIGLFTGTLFGKFGLFNLFVLAPIIVTIIAIVIIKEPKLNYGTKEFKINKIILLIIILALITVVTRSIIGFSIIFPWKSQLILTFILIFGIALGKAMGGILGDKFGWKKIGTSGLLLSIPLIYLGYSNPLFGIIGLFLFNFTMPLTLTLISNVLPGRPGTAFGLTCVALLFGALPFFSELKSLFVSIDLVMILIFVSAIIFYTALSIYKKTTKPKIQ